MSIKSFSKFNESTDPVTFKNTDGDIEDFFFDYIDKDPKSLTIKNGLVYNGNFVPDTTYMKDTSKYRRAKLITLRVVKPDGIQIDMGNCMTDIEMLSNTLQDIQRFYDLSGEEVNYKITTSYMGLIVEFITLGDMVKAEESQTKKIDDYLKRIGECIKKKGFKRQSIKGNWLDIRFSKADSKNYYDVGVSNKLGKIGRGELTIDQTDNATDRELITIRNEAWEDGLEFYITGGDQQVVVKLVKR